MRYFDFLKITEIYRIRIWTLVFLALAFIDLNCYAQKNDNNKPNIILIIADDLGYNDISPYGNKDIETPNLQKMANEGLSFDNMFTSTAMCSPTRQQILTGLYPVRNGAYPNHSHVYDGTKSVVHYLKSAGYKTAIVGKRDFGNKDSFPFTFLGGKNWDAGKGESIPLENAEEFVKNTDEPFFLVVASNQPHVPWVRGKSNQYPPQEINVPEYLVDTKETRESLSKYYSEITYLDSLVGRTLELPKLSKNGNNTIVIFTSEQGPQFPFAKWTCYDQGLKTSFIVKWPDKIDPGTRTKALVQYVDVVPTLLDIIGIEPNKINTGTKDAYGNTSFDGKSFQSVLLEGKKTFRNNVFGVHTTHGIINGTENYPIRSVRDQKYLYIRNLNPSAKFTNVETKKGVINSWKEKNEKRAHDYSYRPSIELYDVQEDPYQLNNLATSSGYDRIIDRMQNELDKFMKQQGDQGVATEAMAGDRNN